MNDYIIWLLFIFVFILIIGLYISDFTPLDLNEREKILKLNIMTEHFTPSVSSTGDQSEGASELYHWGVPDNTVYSPKIKKEECKHECKPECPRRCPMRCPPPTPIVQQCQNNNQNNQKNNNELCSKCDITQNKNIDKYVLKSSIPPCADTSKFITKNMMNANPDLSDYILKSEIKPCEKIDVSNYILKSEIPACPTCPICPECPICPICPEVQNKRCKEIYEYNISDHPDMENYILKDQILNSDIVKKYINQYWMNNDKNNDDKDDKGDKDDKEDNEDNEDNEDKEDNEDNEDKDDKDDDDKDDDDKDDKDDKDEENSNNDINYSSELLSDDVQGYYAGDSLFAGV